MQAVLMIFCRQCGAVIGSVNIDTADMPGELQKKVNRVILAHRQDCKYYRVEHENLMKYAETHDVELPE